MAGLTVFWWRESDGALKGGAGFTRDISTQGAFILADEVPTSTNLEVHILLPWLDPGRHGFQLRGQGHVVRVEHNGFAVSASLEPESRT